jgi:hypothetical protein
MKERIEVGDKMHKWLRFGKAMIAERDNNTYVLEEEAEDILAFAESELADREKDLLLAVEQRTAAEAENKELRGKLESAEGERDSAREDAKVYFETANRVSREAECAEGLLREVSMFVRCLPEGHAPGCFAPFGGACHCWQAERHALLSRIEEVVGPKEV